MATPRKKATRARRSAKPRRTARRARPDAGERALAAVREGWQSALGSLSEADGELRRQLRSLRKETALRTRALRKETAVRTRALNATLRDLQARARKEGRAFARSAEDTVERTLAALNIPSRQEVDRLTRKVEELTRKLDGRRPTRAR